MCILYAGQYVDSGETQNKKLESRFSWSPWAGLGRMGHRSFFLGWKDNIESKISFPAVKTAPQKQKRKKKKFGYELNIQPQRVTL